MLTKWNTTNNFDIWRQQAFLTGHQIFETPSKQSLSLFFLNKCDIFKGNYPRDVCASIGHTPFIFLKRLMRLRPYLCIFSFAFAILTLKVWPLAQNIWFFSWCCSKKMSNSFEKKLIHLKLTYRKKVLYERFSF